MEKEKDKNFSEFELTYNTIKVDQYYNLSQGAIEKKDNEISRLQLEIKIKNDKITDLNDIKRSLYKEKESILKSLQDIQSNLTFYRIITFSVLTVLAVCSLLLVFFYLLLPVYHKFYSSYSENLKQVQADSA